MFEFRLQKVLEFRKMQEGWAKDSYLDSRAARLEVEAKILNVHTRRGNLLVNTPTDISSRRALESTLLYLDAQEREEKLVLNILIAEEDTALQAWHHAKRELETLDRLRETALEEHRLEENRKEQAELDEWSVMRRAA